VKVVPGAKLEVSETSISVSLTTSLNKINYLADPLLPVRGV
jgi:hypothetical protein